MDYVVGSESPVSFHLWSGIGAISAALERKVFMQWGHSTIYPNNYIILTGPSGQTRKGEPIMIAKDFVKTLESPMVPEDTSMEKLIRSMRNASTTYKDPKTGEVLEQSAMSGFLEELAVLLGEQNTKFLAYLTNWYDSRDEWTRTTKHQGDDYLAGVCFNLVAATAPDWIPYMFTKEAIGGGFTSRCLFVVEPRKSKIVADPDEYPIDKKLREDLIHDLEHIHRITGEYHFEPRAKRAYVDWYKDQEGAIARGHIEITDPYFAGYIARRATHAKKVGMALAASRSNNRVITLQDWDKTLALLGNIEKKMPRAFMGVGKPKYIEETDLVMQYLQARIGVDVPRSQILRDLRRFVDDYTLDAATKVLNGMGMLTVFREGSRLSYRYKDPDEKKKKKPKRA